MIGTHLLYFCIFILFLSGVRICASLPKLSRGKYLSKNIMTFFMATALTVIAIGRAVDTTGLGGADAWTYVRDFKMFTKPLRSYIVWDRIIKLKSREPGYYLIAWIVRQITDNYKLYFLVVYGIISYGITKFAVKFTSGKKEFLCAAILVCAYLHSFNVMRNWLAIAVMMLAYVADEEQKKKKSVFLYFFAVCCHYSVAIFILALIACRFVSKFEWTRFRLMVCCIAGCAVVLLSAETIKLFMADTKYRIYASMQSSMLGYIPVMFITALSIYHYKLLVHRNPKNIVLVLMNVVNTCMIYIFVYVGGYRINDAFIITRVLILVEIVRAYFSRESGIPNRRIYQLLIYMFIAMYAVQQYLNICETSKVIPYILGY